MIRQLNVYEATQRRLKIIFDYKGGNPNGKG